jgi:dsRNA-specific ribonuclease
MQANDEAKNREEVRTFYNSLLTAKDHSVLDEIFIPEGVNKEEFLTDLKAKAKAKTLANDSIRKTVEQRRAGLGSRENALTIDSLRKIIKPLSTEEKAKLSENKRVKLSLEHNQDLLKREKDLAKYLTVDEKGRLKSKEKVSYEEIINNSELSVGKRKEILALLYFIEKRPV